MCDGREVRNPDVQTYGTMLQMSRMMANKNSSGWSSSESSDAEEHPPKRPAHMKTTTDLPTLYNLQMMQALQTQLEQKEKEEKEKKRRIPERELPTASTPGSMGVDPALFKLIYNLGYDAGLDKRDPAPPCKICEERRRKNRIAASEQRRRNKEFEETSQKGQ